MEDLFAAAAVIVASDGASHLGDVCSCFHNPNRRLGWVHREIVAAASIIPTEGWDGSIEK